MTDGVGFPVSVEVPRDTTVRPIRICPFFSRHILLFKFRGLIHGEVEWGCQVSGTDGKGAKELQV